MSFWSLIMEPGKTYSQVVKDSFHLSMAALDLNTVPTIGKEVNFPVQLEIDSQKLILCNLSKDLHPQVQLNLNFDKKTRVNFFTTGKATIHLTGFLNDMADFEDFDNASDEESSEDLNSKFDSKKCTKSMPTSMKRKLLVKNDELNANKKPKRETLLATDTDEDSDDEIEEWTDDDTSTDDMDTEEKMDVDSAENSQDSDDFDDDQSFDDDESTDDFNNRSANVVDDESTDDSDVDPFSKGTPSKTQLMALIPNKKRTKNKTPTSSKKKEHKSDSSSHGTAIPGSPKKKKGNEQPKGDVKTMSPKDTSKKQTLSGGIVVEELKEGNGPIAKPGKWVSVYYTGRLQSNNRVFDQTNQGAGFKFRLGRGEVIKGWDVALNGMKVGSKRRMIIPPAMAYGSKGQPPVVPSNSTLVFDVEIRSVN